MTLSPLFNVYRTDLTEPFLVGLAFRDRPLAEKAAQDWRGRCPLGTFVVHEISVQQQEDAARAVLALSGKVKGL